MEKQNTAIDQLIIELTRLGYNFNLYQKEIEKYKDIEKEQIVRAYYGNSISINFLNGEQYYYDQFKKE
jgi:hypothetical protein